MKYFILLGVFFMLCFSCKQGAELPDYGEAIIPGKYTNQMGEMIDSSDLKGKVIVTDFVFTHCPSICPKMAVQMKRVQDKYADEEDLRIISFSIDPKNDTVERLRYYTGKIGADESKWWFVRADKEVIDQTAESLKVFQEADDTAPGGFNHQSRFILIDKSGRVRGYYNGVDAEDVDRLLRDLKRVL